MATITADNAGKAPDAQTAAVVPRPLSIPFEALVGEAWGGLRRRSEPIVARFSRKVRVGSPTECWEWLGASSCGHPSFTIGGQRHEARRVAWVLSRRCELRAGQRVYTTCNRKTCVQPAHLTLAHPLKSAEGRRRMVRLERARVAQAAVAAGVPIASIARALGVSTVTTRELLKKGTNGNGN